MIPIKMIPLVAGRAEEWANGCEQYAVHLTYDLKPILEKWPDATPSVAFERADGEKYPHAWEQEEDVLRIPLTKADTAIAGLCKCVVTVTSGDGQHNSDVFHGRVSQGLDTLGEEPDEPMQGIIEQVNGAAVRAESAAKNAVDVAQTAQADAETASAAALAAGAHAETAANAAERSESGATRAEEAAERAENAEVPAEMIEELIKGYLEENPPEAPVQSVNGKTGEVKLTAGDVGALHDTYMPPVLSVNEKTGNVSLSAADVGAAPAVEDPSHPGCYYRMVDGVQEWINPPLVPGVEYRTAERFALYPVYVKYFNTGSLTNGGTFDYTSENVEPVRSIARMGTYLLPSYENGVLQGGVWCIWHQVTGKTFKAGMGSGHSSLPFNATVWYIKL